MIRLVVVGVVVALMGATAEGAAAVSSGESAPTLAQSSDSAKRPMSAAVARLSKVAPEGKRPSRRPCRPKLMGFAMPATLHAGDVGTARVRLSCAPRRATTLMIGATDQDLAVRTAVTVKRGKRLATFPVRVRPVDLQHNAAIRVRYKGKTIRRSVILQPGLSFVAVTQDNGVNSPSLNVSLTGRSARDIVVKVRTDNAAVKFPATVTLPADEVGIDVAPLSVSTVTARTVVRTSVTLGQRTLTATTVLLPPFDETGTISLSFGNGPLLYGNDLDTELSVTTDRPAPAGGLAVTIEEVDDADDAITLGTPVTTTLAEGDNRTAFYVSANDVTQTSQALLRVTVGTVSKTIEVTVRPRISDFTLPATVQSGASFTGTVTLRGPSDVDTVIELWSNSSHASVPASVTIPAGETSATFEGTTTEIETEKRMYLVASFASTHLYADALVLP